MAFTLEDLDPEPLVEGYNFMIILYVIITILVIYIIKKISLKVFTHETYTLSLL